MWSWPLCFVCPLYFEFVQRPCMFEVNVCLSIDTNSGFLAGLAKGCIIQIHELCFRHLSFMSTRRSREGLYRSNVIRVPCFRPSQVLQRALSFKYNSCVFSGAGISRSFHLTITMQLVWSHALGSFEATIGWIMLFDVLSTVQD